MIFPNPLPTSREALNELANQALSEATAYYPGDFISANRSARGLSGGRTGLVGNRSMIESGRSDLSAESGCRFKETSEW